MILTEKHIIKKSHPYFKEIDEICFKSKNIYNAALYEWRQSFIHNSEFLSYVDIYKKLKLHECSTYLGCNVFQATLRKLSNNTSSYVKAIKAYSKNPKKFLGKPKLPYYKDTNIGRNIAIYNKKVIGIGSLKKNGYLKLSGTSLKIRTKQDPDKIKEVHLVPKASHFVIEVIYEKEPLPKIGGDLVAGIDLGLNNLITVGLSDGSESFIIKGTPLKSINQYYNKNKAKIQSELEIKNNTKWSNRLNILTAKRNNKVTDYLHKSSTLLVNHLVSLGIGTLVIGKNDNWKQDINIGKRNNQNFVSIPHARLIDIISYKCDLQGIKVILTEESYTSKTSFLDNETPYKKGSYLGKRKKRGLFVSSKGKLINADLNGAYQIMKKAIPNIYLDGIEEFVVTPEVI